MSNGHGGGSTGHYSSPTACQGTASETVFIWFIGFIGFIRLTECSMNIWVSNGRAGCGTGHYSSAVACHGTASETVFIWFIGFIGFIRLNEIEKEPRSSKRPNPHKYLLYKPTFSQLFTFLASGFKVENQIYKIDRK